MGALLPLIFPNLGKISSQIAKFLDRDLPKLASDSQICGQRFDNFGASNSQIRGHHLSGASRGLRPECVQWVSSCLVEGTWCTELRSGGLQSPNFLLRNSHHYPFFRCLQSFYRKEVKTSLGRWSTRIIITEGPKLSMYKFWFLLSLRYSSNLMRDVALQ